MPLGAASERREALPLEAPSTTGTPSESQQLLRPGVFPRPQPPWDPLTLHEDRHRRLLTITGVKTKSFFQKNWSVCVCV